MTKAEIDKAVKEWFNIDSYSVLNQLTLEQLFQEVENRIRVYRMSSRRDEMSVERRMKHDDYYDELMEGKVIFGDVFKEPESVLSSSYAVQPLTHKGLWEVAGYVATIDKYMNPEGKPLPSVEVSRYLKNVEVNNKGLMLVQINLAETSSEEIINHLKVMLPEWKKQLEAPAPEVRSFRFGVSTIRKILEYNIIPIMDLLYWAQGEDVRIGMPQLTSFLYPDEFKAGNRGPDNVKLTDHPLAVSFLTEPVYYDSFVDFSFKYKDEMHLNVWEMINMNLPKPDGE